MLAISHAVCCRLQQKIQAIFDKLVGGTQQRLDEVKTEVNTIQQSITKSLAAANSAERYE